MRTERGDTSKSSVVCGPSRSKRDALRCGLRRKLRSSPQLEPSTRFATRRKSADSDHGVPLAGNHLGNREGARRRAAGGKLVQQMENAGLRIGTLRKMTEIRAGHRLNRNLENSSLFQHEREGSASRTTVLFPEKELRIWSPIPIEISCPATLQRTVNQLAKLTNILKNERYYMERKTAPCAVLRPTGKRRKL